jgi:hypothetical protein
MRNIPLLDNGSVNTFPWQRIDAVSDELFEMVIYILFASKLQTAPVQYTTEFRRVQVGLRAESPADKRVQKLQRELQTRLVCV